MTRLERMERQATILEPRAGNLAEELAQLMDEERKGWPSRFRTLLADGEPTAAGGIYYQDSQAPFGIVDFPTITLSTTSLMLWPTILWTVNGAGNYWWVGKKLRLWAFGKITTVATPGNLTVEIRYGTTDNGGVILATSAAQTLVANQTNLSWRARFDVHCRAIGASTNGSLFADGECDFNTAVIAVGRFLIPASAAVAAGVDTTVANGLNIQFKRSGSTAETATVQDLVLETLN